jgi:hypothetical protein
MVLREVNLKGACHHPTAAPVPCVRWIPSDLFQRSENIEVPTLHSSRHITKLFSVVRLTGAVGKFGNCAFLRIFKVIFKGFLNSLNLSSNRKLKRAQIPPSRGSGEIRIGSLKRRVDAIQGGVHETE